MIQASAPINRRRISPGLTPVLAFNVARGVPYSPFLGDTGPGSSRPSQALHHPLHIAVEIPSRMPPFDRQGGSAAVISPECQALRERLFQSQSSQAPESG
jgi:hypothetical protein